MVKEHTVNDFTSFRILRFVYIPGYNQTWRMFYEWLKGMCILLLSEVFINVSYSLLVDDVVPVFYILVNFPSSNSINFRK